MRTYRQMAETLGVVFCDGGCGLIRSHEPGFEFLGVVHWRERRWSRAGSKHFLMLVARLRRETSPEWLNEKSRFDWMYQYSDAVTAQKMAGRLGFRIPAHLFDQDREKCLYLARKRGIALSRYPTIRKWARR